MSKHRPFQIRAIERCRHQNLLLAHGCGVGKTREGMYALIQKPGPALIVAPVSVLETVWMEHYKRWMPNNVPTLLWNRSKSRQQKLLEQSHRVYLTSYESLRARYFDLQRKGFQSMLLDESSKIRNYDAQISSAALAFAGVHTRGSKFTLGKTIPNRYAMSGTPDPNSELDWWTQVKFISGHSRGFHPNYYRFREQYFISYKITPEQSVYKFRDMMFDDLHEAMVPWVDVIKTEDVLPDLETAIEAREVYLNPKERAAYKAMKKKMVVFLESQTEYVAATNVLHKILCLREITSGFLYGDDGSDGPAHFLGDTKLTELRNLLIEIGDNQTIIWYHYEEEKDRILNTYGDRARWQGKPGRERIGVLQDFKDKKFQYLIANPASLKFGENLQYVHYMVFFSVSGSYDNYEQCMRRIARSGQMHKCFIYFLVAHNTYDERLLKMVQTKEKRSHKSLDYFRE